MEKKQFFLEDLKLNYVVSGQGYPVVLLHGWGGSIASFAPVHDYLQQFFRVYSLDLPGFGLSPAPDEIWGTMEYARLIETFLKKLAIEKPIIIGHSFGGRLSIHLGSWGVPHKIVLVDSAGIPPKRSWDYHLKVSSYKLMKLGLSLPLINRQKEAILEKYRQSRGSSDYQQTTGVMRAVFVKVVNEDLRPLLPQITVPTLLVWGDHDTATPLSDGQLMEKLIADSGLVVFEGAGHFSYLDRFSDFVAVMDSFLAKEKMND